MSRPAETTRFVGGSRLSLDALHVGDLESEAQTGLVDVLAHLLAAILSA